MTNDEKYLVLLGLDDDKKPRAARFKYENEAGVRKLAAVKSFKIGHAKTDEAVELALKLTDGKIFSSGKGLVPLVNPATYERLCAVLEIEVAAAASPPAQTAADSDPWAKIRVGTIVLYHDGEKKLSDRGWWPATVTGISKDQKTVTARWTYHPTLKPFTAKANALAILPPKG